MNRFKLTYQHTCEHSQYHAYLKNNAPFYSSKKKRKQSNGKPIFRIPFLGEGYYLWEENLKHAHHWGKTHYKNKYSIVQYTDLVIPENLLLDLTNRGHLKFFEELRKNLISRERKAEHYRVGQLIEIFKMDEKEKPGSFPFKFIKAREDLTDQELTYRTESILFSDQSKISMNLDDCVALCVLDKRLMKYNSCEIIEP